MKDLLEELRVVLDKLRAHGLVETDLRFVSVSPNAVIEIFEELPGGVTTSCGDDGWSRYFIEEGAQLTFTVLPKEPFYHQLSVIFTGTRDVSQHINSEDFRKKLTTFLVKELKCVVRSSVELDGPCTAEPGDPADLM